jgi:hypothetical protein
VTAELLTLPHPSSVVRCGPSLQVDGSSLSADVAADRHEFEWLAVNLAVKPLSNQGKDAAAMVSTGAAGCCNGVEVGDRSMC